MQENSSHDLSIVVPVYNEAENLPKLFCEILHTLAIREWLKAEIIFIDDGSEDSSWRELEQIQKLDSRVVLISFNRNFGQTAALSAGIGLSRGKVIIPLDGDGQNDPADIWKLFDKLSEGYECVSGWRFERSDRAFSRRIPSAMANKIIRVVTGIRIHDSGCTIKAYQGDLLRSIPLYGEMHRLMPFYIHLAGGRITELKVNHRQRKFGRSKYGISRVFRVVQDVLVAKVQEAFSRKPMHLFGNLGFLTMGIGILVFLLSLFYKISGQKDFTQSPLIIISCFCFLIGVQFILSGLIAEIVIRKISLGSHEKPYKIRTVRRFGALNDL